MAEGKSVIRGRLMIWSGANFHDRARTDGSGDKMSPRRPRLRQGCGRAGWDKMSQPRAWHSGMTLEMWDRMAGGMLEKSGREVEGRVGGSGGEWGSGGGGEKFFSVQFSEGEILLRGGYGGQVADPPQSPTPRRLRRSGRLRRSSWGRRQVIC
jgi:hypothetical protein